MTADDDTALDLDEGAAAGVTTIPSWQTARTGPIDQHIGARIRQARGERRLSMSRLGAAIGVSAAQIQKYERAENAIVPFRLHDIARVLQVHVGWFFEDFEPDFGLVFDSLQPSPARPPLTSEVIDMAHDIMRLDRAQRRAVQMMVTQLMGTGDGGGAPANEPGSGRMSGAAD